jgi:uncharacterized protein YerC
MIDKRTIGTTGKFETRAELEYAIHALYVQKRSNRDVGEATGVSAATVSRIRNNKSLLVKQKNKKRKTTEWLRRNWSN